MRINLYELFHDSGISTNIIFINILLYINVNDTCWMKCFWSIGKFININKVSNRIRRLYLYSFFNFWHTYVFFFLSFCLYYRMKRLSLRNNFLIQYVRIFIRTYINIIFNDIYISFYKIKYILCFEIRTFVNYIYVINFRKTLFMIIL